MSLWRTLWVGEGCFLCVILVVRIVGVLWHLRFSVWSLLLLWSYWIRVGCLWINVYFFILRNKLTEKLQQVRYFAKVRIFAWHRIRKFWKRRAVEKPDSGQLWNECCSFCYSCCYFVVFASKIDLKLIK